MVVNGYTRMEEGTRPWSCLQSSIPKDGPVREYDSWNRIWKKCGGGAFYYGVGTVGYLMRHLLPQKVEEGSYLYYCYGFKVIAIPFFVWALVDSRQINKDVARAFTKQAACNFLTLLFLEAIVGVYRESGTGPEEALIATEIASTLIITALFYQTFKKFRPAMHSSPPTELS